MMYDLILTGKFKKSLKLAKKRGLNISLLEERDWRNNLQEVPFAFICVFLNVKIHDRKSALPEFR